VAAATGLNNNENINHPIDVIIINIENIINPHPIYLVIL
jgi:hypothetical protein